MKYVLDVSVAIRWVIPSPLTPKALKLRDEYSQSIHELIAPSIFTAEVASGLTKAERQKYIRVGEARELLFKIFGSLPVFCPFDDLVFRATDISSRTRSGLLDCIYVALAEQEGCDMITTDDKLVRNIQHHFSFVKHLSSLS